MATAKASSQSCNDEMRPADSDGETEPRPSWNVLESTSDDLKLEANDATGTYGVNSK